MRAIIEKNCCIFANHGAEHYQAWSMAKPLHAVSNG